MRRPKTCQGCGRDITWTNRRKWCVHCYAAQARAQLMELRERPMSIVTVAKRAARQLGVQL